MNLLVQILSSQVRARSSVFERLTEKTQREINPHIYSIADRAKNGLRYFVFLSLLAATMYLGTAQASESKFIVIDVRTPQEYQESHIQNSRHIDVLAPDFKAQVSKLDKSKKYKLYCRSGNRSAKAIEIMKAQGFKNLENLGSLHEASLKLQQKCDGLGPC